MMKHLPKILLATVWLLGAATVGLSVHQPSPQPADEELQSGLAELAVENDQIVLTVVVTSESRWRLAVPAPTALAVPARALVPFAKDADPDNQDADTSSTFLFLLRTVFPI